MTQIAQRYLDEIEQICRFEATTPYFYSLEPKTIAEFVRSHWGYPQNYAGLFNHCKPLDTNLINLISGPFCGCLTQIKNSPGISLQEYAVRDSQSKVVSSLTQEIIEDHRIAKNEKSILPEHLRELTELTEEQKQEVRNALLPYAEWQTRLRLHFKDVPVEELELQEV